MFPCLQAAVRSKQQFLLVLGFKTCNYFYYLKYLYAIWNTPSNFVMINPHHWKRSCCYISNLKNRQLWKETRTVNSQEIYSLQKLLLDLLRGPYSWCSECWKARSGSQAICGQTSLSYNLTDLFSAWKKIILFWTDKFVKPRNHATVLKV